MVENKWECQVTYLCKCLFSSSSFFYMFFLPCYPSALEKKVYISCSAMINNSAYSLSSVMSFCSISFISYSTSGVLAYVRINGSNLYMQDYIAPINYGSTRKLFGNDNSRWTSLVIIVKKTINKKRSSQVEK